MITVSSGETVSMTASPFKAAKIPNKSIGLCTSHRITPEAARAMVDAGYQFAVRYLNREKYYREIPDTKWPISCSSQELRELTQAGLDVALTQWYALGDSTAATAANGGRLGEAMVHNARGIGVPEGTTLWLDMEWARRPPEGPGGVMAYANAWFDQVLKANYEAGVYVGCNTLLTAEQLYYRLYCTQYWQSCSDVPEIPVRGHVMRQGHSRKNLFARSLGTEHQIKTSQPCYVRTDLRGGRFRVVRAA